MASWTIEIHNGNNGQIVTSTVTPPNDSYHKTNVETYPQTGASIPAAVVSYLESRDALMSIVQVMFIDDAPGGSGTSPLEITDTESNMVWDDIAKPGNGVVVVYHESNQTALAHRKSDGKVKLGDKEE